MCVVIHLQVTSHVPYVGAYTNIQGCGNLHIFQYRNSNHLWSSSASSPIWPATLSPSLEACLFSFSLLHSLNTDSITRTPSSAMICEAGNHHDQNEITVHGEEISTFFKQLPKQSGHGSVCRSFPSQERTPRPWQTWHCCTPYPSHFSQTFCTAQPTTIHMSAIHALHLRISQLKRLTVLLSQKLHT